jgi:hypothetical protein
LGSSTEAATEVSEKESATKMINTFIGPLLKLGFLSDIPGES